LLEIELVKKFLDDLQRKAAQLTFTQKTTRNNDTTL